MERNLPLIRRTKGIDEAIKVMEKRFPRGFPKYFEQSLIRLDKENDASKTSRREKTAPQKEAEEKERAQTKDA